jgi:hypothetical protein
VHGRDDAAQTTTLGVKVKQKYTQTSYRVREGFVRVEFHGVQMRSEEIEGKSLTQCERRM